MKFSFVARLPRLWACAKSTSAPSVMERQARLLAPCKLNSTSLPADDIRAPPGGYLRCRRSTPLWPEPENRDDKVEGADMKKHKHHPETEAVHGGTDLGKKNGPLATPIYQTSTFEVTD